MTEQITAKYLGCFGGGYKFEDDSKNVIIFKRCEMEFVRKYGLWADMSINQKFQIDYVNFNKYITVINSLVKI